MSPLAMHSLLPAGGDCHSHWAQQVCPHGAKQPVLCGALLWASILGVLCSRVDLNLPSKHNQTALHSRVSYGLHVAKV